MVLLKRPRKHLKIEKAVRLIKEYHEEKNLGNGN